MSVPPQTGRVQAVARLGRLNGAEAALDECGRYLQLALDGCGLYLQPALERD
jgi:hypothetical protein